MNPQTDFPILQPSDNGFSSDQKAEVLKRLRQLNALFNISAKIEETKRPSSFASIFYNLIGISFIAFDPNEVAQNIDEEYDDFPVSTFGEVSCLLVAYLHEAAHFLTVTTPLDERVISIEYRFEDVRHRSRVYEKLADNVAYHLLYHNYDLIGDVLNGVPVELDESRVKANLEICKKLKDRYVTENVISLIIRRFEELTKSIEVRKAPVWSNSTAAAFMGWVSRTTNSSSPFIRWTLSSSGSTWTVGSRSSYQGFIGKESA